METMDKDLCEKLVKENEEFKDVYNAHQGYKKQLQKIAKKGFLSTEDEQEKKRLKKLKLAAKDKIENFLAKCRKL